MRQSGAVPWGCPIVLINNGFITFCLILSNGTIWQYYIVLCEYQVGDPGRTLLFLKKILYEDMYSRIQMIDFVRYVIRFYLQMSAVDTNLDTIKIISLGPNVPFIVGLMAKHCNLNGHVSSLLDTRGVHFLPFSSSSDCRH